jgi:erythromycin esterase-like protein
MGFIIDDSNANQAEERRRIVQFEYDDLRERIKAVEADLRDTDALLNMLHQDLTNTVREGVAIGLDLLK